MKSAIIIFIMILFLIFAGASIFFMIREISYNNHQNKENSNQQNQDLNNNKNNSAQDISLNSSGSSSSSERSGGSTSSGSSSQSQTGPTLPSDVNTVECGLYTNEYGVCAGTCPSGTCVAEGRSCYCKS